MAYCLRHPRWHPKAAASCRVELLSPSSCKHAVPSCLHREPPQTMGFTETRASHGLPPLPRHSPVNPATPTPVGALVKSRGRSSEADSFMFSLLSPFFWSTDPRHKWVKVSMTKPYLFSDQRGNFLLCQVVIHHINNP